MSHTNNKHDPIPILPPRVFGYHHPSGEIHIDDSGAWMACSGTWHCTVIVLMRTRGTQTTNELFFYGL
jgi:hypothetical protein